MTPPPPSGCENNVPKCLLERDWTAERQNTRRSTWCSVEAPRPRVEPQLWQWRRLCPQRDKTAAAAYCPCERPAGEVHRDQQILSFAPPQEGRHARLVAVVQPLQFAGPQLEKVSPDVHAPVVQAATSRAQTAALVRVAAPQIEGALRKGSPSNPVSCLDFRRALIESNLRGRRDRWQHMAESAAQSTNDDLPELFGQWTHALKAIHEESIGEPLPSPALTAAALLERNDMDGLRAFLSETFERAADRVTRMMPEAEYDRITRHPGFAGGLAAYKRLVEQPVRANHLENEGVLSDALGPLDTHYPLIRLDQDDQPNKTGRSGRAVPYRKPRNIANYFSTGHAEAYDPGMEGLSGRLREAFRVNNKAAAVQAIVDYGLGRILDRGERAPDTIAVRGVEYRAVKVETKPDRQIVTPKSSVFVPAAHMLIPAWLEEELRPIRPQRN